MPIISVALDAMGGDYAPRALVAGAAEAIKNLNVELLLVGNKARLKEEISLLLADGLVDEGLVEQRLKLIPADQTIGMDEEPIMALRKKKDASISVATRLVKEGKAKAVVSAGSTGAQMAAALLILGRIKGVERPAIATVMPGLEGPIVLVDSGANVDCRAKHLEQFALMGSAYASTILEIKDPRVALLNIGTEETKGTELTRQAYKLLKATRLNFIGNIEGRDFLRGQAEVVVCDGFVGNVVLKLTEGLVTHVFTLLKEELTQGGPHGADVASIFSTLNALTNRLDYTSYGGAPLLGIQGVSVICHGSSKARAIYNAIRVAQESIENKLVDQITYGLT